MCTTFAENGLSSTDKKAVYMPHLTIAKTSKTSGRKRVKKIDPKCYEEYKHDCFGTQPINTLELLSMRLPADSGGYYHCFSRETFIATDTATQSCEDDTTSDVKHSTVDGDERENITVMSTPCTAVKFIPRVLVTKKQEPGANDNSIAVTEPSTETEMDLTEQK